MARTPYREAVGTIYRRRLTGAIHTLRPLGTSLTVSNDRRLADRDNKDFEICELLTPHTGDEAFDDDFRIVDEWTEEAREINHWPHAGITPCVEKFGSDDFPY